MSIPAHQYREVDAQPPGFHFLSHSHQSTSKACWRHPPCRGSDSFLCFETLSVRGNYILNVHHVASKIYLLQFTTRVPYWTYVTSSMRSGWHVFELHAMNDVGYHGDPGLAS